MREKLVTVLTFLILCQIYVLSKICRKRRANSVTLTDVIKENV